MSYAQYWNGELAVEIPALSFWDMFDSDHVLHHVPLRSMDAYMMMGSVSNSRMVAFSTASGRVAAVFKRAFFSKAAKACYETYKVIPFIRKDVRDFLIPRFERRMPAFHLPHEMALYTLERSYVLHHLDLGCCSFHLLLTPPPFTGQVILYTPADGSEALVLSGRIFYTASDLKQGNSYHKEILIAS